MLRDKGRSLTLLWLIAAALAPGCNREVGAPANGAPESAPHPAPPPSEAKSAAAVVPSPSTATATATTTATAMTSAQASEPERPFVLVELAPTMGDLLPLLREHAARAREKKLRPFVEFYADWCRPCRDLHASMGNAQVIDALRNTYIVKLNFDDWQDKIDGSGFVPRKIPVFYAIGADGRATGRKVALDSGVKITPENIAPLLKAFFQG